ncbi:MAG TPA: aminopeptidase N, partial [Micromonosporaceae bacterium]|nr:aminopeptidase N [Micromonosporaceae bacterium]
WLETAQVNTLRPTVSIAPDGTYSSVEVIQEAPAEYPTLRPHRIGIGLYDLVDGVLTRRDRLEADVAGPSTPIPALAGVKAPDVLLLNDDDLTYTKLRLDERSLSTVVDHLSAFDSALPRALVWAAAWDMVRDAEMAARDYVKLATSALPKERDINLVTTTLRQLTTVIAQYTDPAWTATGWSMLAETARRAMAEAEPGSGFQLAWVRTFISAARSSADLALLNNWLSDVDVPQGVAIAGELRWQLVQALVATGAIEPSVIELERAVDQTAAGDIGAATATALIPSLSSKEAVWNEITTDPDVINSRNRALILGFQHPAQVELTAPFMPKFFADVANVWKIRDSEPGQDFLVLAYPIYQVSPETVAAAQAWLSEEGHPAPLRRLVAEGNDRVMRALKARARDASA